MSNETGKREVEVWVSLEEFCHYTHINAIRLNHDGPMKGDSVKAKLIIELPERKVEITEAEFDEAVDDSPLQYDYAVRELKQKLFGERS